MSEKTPLTLTNEHVLTLPGDVHQIIVTDSNIYSGKDYPNPAKRSCFKRLNVFVSTMIIGVTVIALLLAISYLQQITSVSGTVDSGYYVSINRDVLNPLRHTVKNVERLLVSLPDVFNQNKLSSIDKESDVTILYLSREPVYSLYNYFEFKSVYIARNYQTTLSFVLKNNQSSTYLDDVSVNNTYGSQLIVNGNFSSGTYGWKGFSSSYAYYYSTDAAVSSYINGALLQTFNTSPGEVLHISFKLRWTRYGSGIFTKVTIY